MIAGANLKYPSTPEWFIGGETNVCYNALDRHVLDGHGDQVRFLLLTVSERPSAGIVAVITFP